MTDGFWRIKQFSPGSSSGFTVTEISIRARRSPLIPQLTEHDPQWDANHIYIKFMADGREQYFPWASIVHAEYQPPTADESKP